MANITKLLTVNGWSNLNTALIAAIPGYQGGRARSVTVLNNSATNAYFHVGDIATQPATAADGFPFSTSAAFAPSASYTAENADIAAIWVNTGASIGITVMVIGAQ